MSSFRASIKTHHRHFRQQSVYTFCVRRETKGAPPYIARYEDILFELPGQGRFWKFEIPTTERDAVLAYLDKFNLNAYSLYGSEESLLETLAYRERRRLEQTRTAMQRFDQMRSAKTAPGNPAAQETGGSS